MPDIKDYGAIIQQSLAQAYKILPD